MKKKPPKKTQTKHRVAASNPEVHERINKLKENWKHSSSEEIKAMVSDLLLEGCSIRGLAGDIGVAATTIRLRLKSASARSQTEGHSSHGQIPAKKATEQRSDLTREKPTGAPLKIQRPMDPLPAAQSQTAKAPITATAGPPAASHKPAPSGNELPPATKLPPRPDHRARQPDREEPLKSLSSRAEKIIIDLLYEELVDTGEVATALNVARGFMDRNDSRSLFVRLPRSLSIRELLATTEAIRINLTKMEYVGRWVAKILNSLIPDDESRRISIIEGCKTQLLSSQPEKTNPVHSAPAPPQTSADPSPSAAAPTPAAEAPAQQASAPVRRGAQIRQVDPWGVGELKAKVDRTSGFRRGTPGYGR